MNTSGLVTIHVWNQYCFDSQCKVLETGIIIAKILHWDNIRNIDLNSLTVTNFNYTCNHNQFHTYCPEMVALILYPTIFNVY